MRERRERVFQRPMDRWVPSDIEPAVRLRSRERCLETKKADPQPSKAADRLPICFLFASCRLAPPDWLPHQYRKQYETASQTRICP